MVVNSIDWKNSFKIMHQSDSWAWPKDTIWFVSYVVIIQSELKLALTISIIMFY